MIIQIEGENNSVIEKNINLWKKEEEVLEEVRRHSPWRKGTLVLDSIEDLERPVEVIVQCQDRRYVATSVAVVRSRPHCH